MPDLTTSLFLQLIVGLGLLNVWLLRAGSPTGYRGGDSQSLREEFTVYGLGAPVFHLVRILKVGSGIALIAGVWMPQLALPAAAIVAGLMVCALAMHVKVGDPPLKSLPAFLMLAMSSALCLLQGA